MGTSQVVCVQSGSARGASQRSQFRQSLSFKILNMVLLMIAEIERELISQRTKAELARRNAEGKQLGRPKGSNGVSKLE